MHREQLRLQDRQRSAGALKYQHYTQPLCPPKYGAEKAMRRADV